MKNLFLLIPTLIITFSTFSQDTIQSKFVSEFGVTSTNFKTFDVSFKVGGKNNLFFRAQTMNLLLEKEILDHPDTNITILNSGAGFAVGVEKRFYSNPNLFWAIGIDVFGYYSVARDSINNRDNKILSSYKDKLFTQGIAIPFSFNYLFAKSHLMASFEFAPTYSKTTRTVEHYKGGGLTLIENETERYITTQWAFLNTSTVHFSIAYRFFKGNG